MLRESLALFAALALAPSGWSLSQSERTPESLVSLTPAAQWTHISGTVWTATWTQNGVAHYAISLDGKTLATQRETSYELLFRRATFDPLKAAPDFSESKLRSSERAFVVQFWTQPLAEYSEALDALSGEIYDHVGNHAFLVHLSPEAAQAAAALPFVRWVGPFHPEYKLEPALLNALGLGSVPGSATYNVQVFKAGLEQKAAVAARIAQVGGVVELMSPHGRLMRATLSPLGLRAVAELDQVSAIDRWGAPEADLDIVRQISGANALQTATGFQGQGVRGEVLDSGVWTTHVDFQHDGGVHMHGGNGSTSHGTQVYGIVFGNGTGQAVGKGLLPMGYGIASSYETLGDRFAHSLELVDPLFPYQAVFQTNSWGSPLTTAYGTESALMDDIIMATDLLITQSQSNAGSQNSRPEAWAKNIVSVGGIVHNNTLTTADDTWGGASIGPAQDGRLKPDLSHFYDSVWAPASGSNTAYGNFSGTSSATPCTVGHFGLFYQLWHNGVFGNPTGATVFASRPHFTLAKAALVNTGKSYPFTGANHNLTRTHQGWGLADVDRLYTRRTKTFWINQTEPVDNLETVTYTLPVSAGETELKATMVYREPGGTVSTTQHRKNDLTLKVTSPGGTIYWGNNGLNVGNWSTSGGSANTKDTVENVFVQNPAAGTWTIQVIGSDVNTDIRPDVSGVNADFGLWVTGVDPVSCTSATTYCTSLVSSSGCVPAMGATGLPSLSSAGSFTASASNLEAGVNGLLFFGTTGQASSPFFGGTLCVNAPLYRMAVGNTGGAGTCSGSLSYTLASMLTHPSGGGLLGSGTVVDAQVWFRDSAAPQTVGLANGLRFTICP